MDVSSGGYCGDQFCVGGDWRGAEEENKWDLLFCFWPWYQIGYRESWTFYGIGLDYYIIGIVTSLLAALTTRLHSEKTRGGWNIKKRGGTLH